MNKILKEKVSIIAICHNHPNFVLATLNSIKNQTYNNIELLVINNLKDKCQEIIEKWIEENNFNIKLIQNDKPLSVTQNSNLGLKNITGKYFQIISCDDVLLPHKLKSQVDIFKKYPFISCVFSDAIKIDENSNFLEKFNSYNYFEEGVVKHNDLIDELAKGAFLIAPSVLLRTNDIVKVGGYEESYPMEDYPMWLKLAQKNKIFYLQKKITVKYRILKNSISNTRDDFYTKNELRLKLKYSKILKYRDENKLIFCKTCYGFVRSGYCISLEEINKIKIIIKPNLFFYFRIQAELFFLKFSKIIHNYS